MKKFLSVAVMLLAFAAIANAQGKLGFTVEAGLNLSKFGGDTSDGESSLLYGDCEMKPGFQIGVMVDVPFTDAIYLKSGLKYTQLGSKSEWKDDNEDTTDKVILGCLQLPILFSYRYAISNSIELQGNVGPYLAVALHGKYKYECDENGHHYESDEDIEFGDEFKRFDFGLVLPSIGVKISNFYVGVSNEIGLINLSADDDFKFHNYCFSINVGYTF